MKYYDAELVKSSISMVELAELYGLESNRKGQILCPFHTDTNPSLKLYDEVGKGFYCFACQAGGSVIDFVMLYESIDFTEAVKKLGDYLNLDGTSQSEFSQRRQEREQQRKYYEEVARKFTRINTILRQEHEAPSEELAWALQNEMPIKLELGRLEGDKYKYV